MRRVRTRDLVFWSSSSTLFAVACVCLSLYLNNVYSKHLQLPESCEYDIITVLHYSGLVEQSLMATSFLTLFFSAGTLLLVVLFARQIRSHKTTQPTGERE